MKRLSPAWFCVPPLLLAAFVFFYGIGWGLPSRAVDPFLFGNRTPWSGQKIMQLAGHWGDQADRGADVDANPILDRSHLVRLNQTDAQRAEIIRRYRLYSYQPDEWITLKSLATLKSHHGDPRVYQYGGLWIYPVGALLKLASLPPLRYITLNPDPAFYLDHPELFGRFYIIARAYSALWGLAGVIAIFWLLRQWQVRPILAMAGAAAFCLVPVVVNMAHEAKPHLAGTVLLLGAIGAASRYAQRGGWKPLVAAGVLCGAALGMVLSSLLGFILLPLMVLPRPLPWRGRLKHLLAALLIALGVYAVTNPFVFINALTNRQILMSNLGTSTAMYPVNGLASGLRTTIDLVGEGASRPLAIAGLAGVVALCLRRKLMPPAIELWLLGAPALVVLATMAALGAGKPGEFGRFGLLPDVGLLLFAFLAVDRLVGGTVERVGLVLLLLGSTGFFGGLYLRGFVRDASDHPGRLIQADTLRRLGQAGNRTMALVAEPAPYSLPPVNLFEWKLLLLPRDEALRSDELLPDLIVRTTDLPATAQTSALLIYEPVADPTPHSRYQPRISWADKPLDIRVRRHQHPVTLTAAPEPMGSPSPQEARKKG
jgi:hypothetical protein